MLLLGFLAPFVDLHAASLYWIWVFYIFSSCFGISLCPDPPSKQLPWNLFLLIYYSTVENHQTVIMNAML